MSLLRSSTVSSRSGAGGPQEILKFLEPVGGIEGNRFNDEGFNDGGFGFRPVVGGGGRIINFDPIVVLPRPTPTAAELAQSLSAGLTPAQLDQAAKFETQ